MNKRNTNGLLLVILMLLSTTIFAAGNNENNQDPTSIDVQDKFDYMGPVVNKLELSNGKTVAYVDEGEKDWIPVLFVGGAGTAERVMSLVDFHRSFRTQLGIRLITVGRNGFGETDYVPNWGYDDYAAEVEEVLDYLGVDKFVGLAISGGGGYLATVSAAMPDRIQSIHMAVAHSEGDPEAWNAVSTVEEIEGILRTYPANPLSWWDLGATSPMAIVPGFQDTANADGTRSFFMGGQLGVEDAGTQSVQRAMAEEYKRFSTTLTDLSGVTAPTYTYYSPEDTSVGLEHAQYWKDNLNVVKARLYANDGHATQYRHWGQIMLDIAGFSDYLLVSNAEGSMIVTEAEGIEMLEANEVTLGIRAWQTGERN